MKLARLHLMLSLVVIILLATLASLSAQDPKPRKAEEILAGQRVKQLTTLLQLSDEQKGKIEPIVFEEFKLVSQVKDDEKLSLQEKFTRQDAIRAESKTKIKSHLNTEQLAKWDELEKKGKKPKK